MLLNKYRRFIVGTYSYVASAVIFGLTLLVGYHYGGMNFVTVWGGSIAAVWSTVYLIYKSQMYWLWTVGYSVLWGVLFFQQGLNALGAYQFITIALCVSGMVQWFLVKRGIGVNWARTSDRWVTGFTTIAVAIAIWAYWPTNANIWWIMQISSVLFAVFAIWGDAFRYKGNWIAWTISNIAFVPLCIQGHLWAPLGATFVYQTLDFIGFFHWLQEERAGIEDVEDSADQMELATPGVGW